MAVPAAYTMAARASRTAPTHPLTPQEETSLLGKAASRTLGGLSALGNFLDVPGSMIRDMAVGENPFDQLLSPLTADNRTTGREVLQEWDILGRNTSGFDLGDVAGFGFEVLADPLTYATLGASALGKGGKIAKAAGVIDDLAPKAAQAIAGNKVGRRVSNMTVSLQDMIPHATGAQLDSLRDAAMRQGYRGLSDALRSVGTQKLGGLVGFGAPLGGSSVAMGSRRLAQCVAGGMDAVTAGVRNSTLGRHGAAIFSRAQMGATSEFGQQLGRAASRIEEEAGQFARQAFVEDIREFAKYTSNLGSTAERLDAHDAYRAALEGTAPLPQGMEHLQEGVERYQKLMSNMLDQEQLEGLTTKALDDLYVNYATRTPFRFPGEAALPSWASKLLSGAHGSQKHRRDFLRNVRGGTSLLNRLSLNRMISGSWHKLAPKDKTRPTMDLIESIVNKEMQNLGLTSAVTDTRQIAKWVANLDPRHAKEGIPIFPHNPLDEGLRRLEMGHRATGLARLIRETMLAHGHESDDAPPGSVSAQEIFEAAGLDPAVSRKLLAEAHPQGADNLFVPRELADDIGRVVKAFQNPDELNPVLEAVDKFTRLFKTGVTSIAPAFHSRNFTSGQIQNMLIGGWSTSSMGAAYRLIAGKPVKGLKRIGAIRRRLADKGIDVANATDEQATEALADLAFEFNVAPRGQGQAGLEDVGAALGSSLDVNVAADIPGVLPSTIRGSARELIPKKDTPWSVWDQINPLNVAGVRTQTDVNVFARSGRAFGSWTEGMNRLTPFIEFLKKGIDPAEAARRVASAHVDYANLSASERKILRRIFPFYSFARGMSEHVVRELLERPGGPLAQTIRAQNVGRDPDRPVPDYVGQTMAVPLEGGEGRRYLTGLSLMHEDPASLLTVRNGRPDTSDFLAELVSRSNPIGKAAIEIASGESFFQRGPRGGRDLDDMDPTLGRLRSNLNVLLGGDPIEDASGRAKPVISRNLEHLIANTPASRLLTSLRTGTDERKGAGARAVNLLTGFRVHDVTQAAEEGIIRDELSATMREIGARSFERVYFGKDDIEKTRKTDPEMARRMEQLNGLMRLLGERAKARKKPAE